jgi:effector-binding domain-containing protein
MGATMEYQVQVVDLVPQMTAVIRMQARPAELSRVVPQACGEVWNFVKAAKLPRAGRHIALYLDGVMNIEVGVEMFHPFVGDGRVVCSTTPAGKAATAVHMGPYSRLGEAHDAVGKWCADHGHKLAGPSWEVYGHWDDDPAKVRTDVFWLLQP